ncbi:hypothetical protein MT340_005220 [Staphylococcus sp. NRL 16/872]|uniref:hypothetical protein n=1 Tax=Staphylococcus sp. NRL 16/872 TaxID=2930131 RepID=UPI001FB4860C|nr:MULTISPECIES: hypothetical protein [unclassified Staphylococcus]MCJ1667821.1 hypothetical protein [Staphylococcus sp. NRL 19/737]WEN70312.1 hypothetical protein MT340_005220 [Staphylococcus sp. NRL 16/872]
MECIGFADVKEFVKISGLSKDDFEKKIASNKGFQQECMYRFEGSRKRYIKVRKAIDYIENNLMVNEASL